VHYPGAEMVFGSYHPMGALYHHSVSITKARLAVKSLVASLASNNVEPGPRPQGGVAETHWWEEPRHLLSSVP